MKNEINLSYNYRKSLITTLSGLSNFYANKPFSEITREDLQEYLNSLRKPEPIDPFHKCIGTYNYYLSSISKFFKWSYYPDLPQKERLKPTVVDNLTQLKRKKKSIYKPSDLWTQDDDQLFLKYCPLKRDRCYYIISRNTAFLLL